MLRDCISASVVLCDKSLRIISLATWPRNLEAIIKKGVEELEGLPPDQQSAEFALLPDVPVFYLSGPGTGTGESRESAVLQQTLEVYLLDANCSTSRCAELLFLHKNTVKYRQNRIKEQFGHPLDKLPEVFPLYYAAALMRITNN